MSIKIIAVPVLAVALFVGGFFTARKMTSHVLVYDPAKKVWVPLQSKTDIKIAVASPLGIEPGVAYKFLEIPKEGKVVIVLPPSLIPDDAPDQSGPELPGPQNQSDHERMDRTDLMNKVSF